MKSRGPPRKRLLSFSRRTEGADDQGHNIITRIIELQRRTNSQHRCVCYAEASLLAGKDWSLRLGIKTSGSINSKLLSPWVLLKDQICSFQVKASSSPLPKDHAETFTLQGNRCPCLAFATLASMLMTRFRI